jgi:uncharacterized protein (TIGR03435 family)
MTALQRHLYRAIIRLHPAAFRDEFGREMALDFEDAMRDRGFTPLLGDAMLSLARQWKSRALNGPELDPALAQPVPGHPFLSGQYLAADQGRLTAFDLASASFLSLLLVLTIALAAAIPNRRAIANVQTARVSHDGGIDTGGNGPPLATKPSRREWPGADPIRTAAGLGVGPQHGPAYLVRSAAPPGFGPRAIAGPPAQPITLVHALVQLILISAIVWVTSLFLLRSPGIIRRTALATLGLLGIAASVAFGQTRIPPTHAQILHATTPLPSFEVATIKPRDRNAYILITPPGSENIVRMVGPARHLIAMAYNLPSTSQQRILGGPDWIGDSNKSYVIEGKIPDDLYTRMQKMTTDERHAQACLMLQSLLADRFKLKLHFESREMPVFELTIAKDGPKLPPPNAPPANTGDPAAVSAQMAGGMAMSGQRIRVRNMKLDLMLTAPYFGLADRPIVNKTGLTGIYNLTLSWAPTPPATAGPDAPLAAPEGPSIFTALEEQLGLKLVPAKDSVEVVVIDHIERPSEN